MKCPNCGKTNGKTSKYCRECGTRLEHLVDRDASRQENGAPRSDEVSLGEDLFEIWQLIESGDLDTALVEARKIIEASPESTSAHSFVALIYERKAEAELSHGRVDTAHNLLRHAVDHYERVIDLNPDSVADREKLASLRTMLARGVVPGFSRRVLALKATARRAPLPVLAASVVFAVVLVLSLVLFRGGSKESAVASLPADQGKVKVTATEAAPQSPPEPSLSVYTFPSNPAASPARIPTPPEAKAAQPPPVPDIDEETVKPAKLPVIIAPGISVIPEAKEKPESAKPAKPTPVSPAEDKVTGAGVLARAIQLHNQGNNQEAIGAAEQAIVLFQADIDAGRNTEAARRGIENARKLKALWQQSVTLEE